MAGQRQPPTARLRRLAAELRRRREDAGLAVSEAADRTGINETTIYRIEHAQARPQRRTLQALLDLYAVPKEEQPELIELLRDARQRGWLQAYQSVLPEQYFTYITFEGEAESSHSYDALVVPGLLQTEAYARAVMLGEMPTITPAEADRRVEVRMNRQDVLTKEHPLSLWAVIDQAALYRLIGGRSVMRDQIRHVLDLMDLPNVTVQVIPFQVGAHPGLPGSFVHLRFADRAVPDVVYVGSLAGDLFLDGETDIRRFSLVFEHLCAASASPVDTRSFLAASLAEQ
jgi:transcriptional regulator with XRE-family HTH domain